MRVIEGHSAFFFLFRNLTLVVFPLSSSHRVLFSLVKKGVLNVYGPSTISNGVTFTLTPSVWSPFWTAITVTASVTPIGGVTFNPTTYTLNTATAKIVTVVSQRSDDSNITLTWQWSSTRHIAPPNNVVVANVGVGLFTLAGGNKCWTSGNTRNSITPTVGGAHGNSLPTLSSPHRMVYSKRTERFYIASASSIDMFDPATQMVSLGFGNIAATWSNYLNAD